MISETGDIPAPLIALPHCPRPRALMRFQASARRPSATSVSRAAPRAATAAAVAAAALTDRPASAAGASTGPA
eukprot:364822-Chlamydomonas_euryale.AAC.7